MLVGLSPENECVYSEIISLDEYWDEEHAWDSDKEIKKLRLAKLKGFLFDSQGALLQEFESHFDLKTGTYAKGWTRHADGTL
jgi:hypothetical protein